MTDRELLELAAKAAGINQTGWDDTDPDIEPALVAIDENDCAYHWNPLADDGDAFRLMVLVGIDVCGDSAGTACAWCPPISDFVSEPGGSDLCAATRRAIVRAAAEVGRRMP